MGIFYKKIVTALACLDLGTVDGLEGSLICPGSGYSLTIRRYDVSL